MVDDVRGPQPLPWPPAWKRPSLGGWRVTVLCGVLLIPLLAATAGAIGQNQPGRAGWLGASAVILGGIGLTARPRRRPWIIQQVSADAGAVREAGVRFAVRPATVLTGIGLTVAGVALLALVVLMLVLVVVQGEAQFLIGMVVVGAPGVLLLLGGIAALTSNRADNAVDVTPWHVVVNTGHGRTAVAWAEIDDITGSLAALPVGRSAAIQNLIVIEVAPAHEHAGRLVVACDRLVSDPALVYHGLRYYLRHPDDRDELASVAAIRRMEAGRVVDADELGEP